MGEASEFSAVEFTLRAWQGHTPGMAVKAHLKSIPKDN